MNMPILATKKQRILRVVNLGEGAVGDSGIPCLVEALQKSTNLKQVAVLPRMVEKSASTLTLSAHDGIRKTVQETTFQTPGVKKKNGFYFGTKTHCQ